MGACLCTGLCPLAATIADGEDREAQVFLHHKDGHRLPAGADSGQSPEGSGRKSYRGVELFTDISNIQANSLRVQELEKLSLLDNLTQLANRNYLERELRGRFEEHRRLRIAFGILFIDIDHFKRVNDTYGHDIGDELADVVDDDHVTQSFDSFFLSDVRSGPHFCKDSGQKCVMGEPRASPAVHPKAWNR